jgi:hypothetical protein
MEVSDHLHAPAALRRGQSPGTHWLRGCAHPKAGLDAVEKNRLSFPGIEPW